MMAVVSGRRTKLRESMVNSDLSDCSYLRFLPLSSLQPHREHPDSCLPTLAFHSSSPLCPNHLRKHKYDPSTTPPTPTLLPSRNAEKAFDNNATPFLIK